MADTPGRVLACQTRIHQRRDTLPAKACAIKPNSYKGQFMNIPILRLPFNDSDKAEILKGMASVFDSGHLTMGRFTQEFEKQTSELTGAKYSIATSNCTTALEIIIRALGIYGKSIIVPTNTFLATAFAVMHSGNRVIFADSSVETLC